MSIEFRVLGDVNAVVDGYRVGLGHPRQLCVLAVLLMEPNRTLTVGTLVDRTWGEHRPHRPEGTLRSYLSRLRRALATMGQRGGLRRGQGGYLLAVDPSAVDVHRFRELAGQARASKRDDEAAALFRQALALWRGDAFATLHSPWLDTMRDVLAVERLEAQLDLTDIALRRGQPSEALATLVHSAATHPLDERLAGQVMLALYRTGRPAEALRHYHKIRVYLAEELGTDPSSLLQRLHQQIITADPGLASVTQASPAPQLPRQLPGSIPHFVGRVHEMKLLTAQLDQADAVIALICGTAGVGKTALAIHWARQVRDRFPDGQLYVNLRGFDVGGKPMTPADAVRGFLDALSVPAARIPSDPDAQAALYRSTVQDRRMLVVLDNVASSEQVRPLLPGSPQCMVLVTSRQQLSGLIAREHAVHLALDLMSDAEATDLLTHLLGAQRVLADPGTVSELVRLCVGLPLALGIAASRAITQPDLPLGVLVGQLREERDRLTTLSTGDSRDTDLRAVFSWSYSRLSAPAARLFRLLGTHPGPDIGVAAAASLTGSSATDTRTALAELTRAYLLDEHVPNRYEFHDLLRVYAGELDSDEDATLTRIFDHYLHTSCAAALVLQPSRTPIPLPTQQPGVVVESLADHETALAWFNAEHPVLRAVLALAADRGYDDHVWRLAWAMRNYQDRRGLWRDQLAVHQAGLDAARRLQDRLGLAHAGRGLGVAYAKLGRWDEATDQLLNALDQFQTLADAAGQGHTHLDLGWVAVRRGRPEDGLDHAQQALERFRTARHVLGQANALNGIGWLHAMLGDYQQALDECRRALVQFQEIGDLHGEAPTWDSIGFAHHQLGQYGDAIACYEHSLALYRKLGNRYYEADILTHLGDSHAATRAADAARTAWRQALAILTELDHSDAAQVRVKLDQLDRTDIGGSR